MNKILIILSFLLIACSNNKTKDNASHKDQHEESEVTSTSLKLNNGAKRKSDDATRKNVAAISKIINDSSRDVNNRPQLVKLLQARIDTLVMQCKMKGPEHDALHVWLNQVLHNLKELKESGEGEYEKSYAALKKDVDGFYDFFE